MATTGTNTAAQWNAAANKALAAAARADLEAFKAEQAVLSAKIREERARDEYLTAQQRGDPVAIAAAYQNVQATKDTLLQSTVIAAEYRTQSDNANDASDAAELLADQNRGSTPSTPPPATVTPSQPATSYIPEPPIQPVTSPSTALTTNYTANSTVVTNTIETTTTVTQTTGGSSTTRYNSQSVATPESKNLNVQANIEYNNYQVYQLNPNTPFGSRALDRKLAAGEITQEQYADVKNSTNEERQAKVQGGIGRYQELRKQAIAAQIPGQAEVVVVQQPNTTETTVEGVQTLTVANTKISGEIAGTGVTTETIDGTTYQVTKNSAQNTTTFTDSSNPNFGVTVPTTNIQNATPDQIAEPASEIGQAGLALPIAQRQAEDADPEGTANIQEQNAAAQRQVQDNDPEGTANIQEQNAAAQRQVQDNAGEADTLQPLPIAQRQAEGAADPEGNANVAEQTIPITPLAQRLVQDNDPEGTANIQEQNAAANQAAIRDGQEGVNLNPSGITSGKTVALNSGQDFKPVPDWRVRLSLAPGANYLYKVGTGAAGILNPLQATEGVIFPYTPAISVAYAANYTPFDPTHSNYKIYQYTNSSVDAFSITCDFTAQDTTEANYLLAVIHFFKSITKMFYGQDQNPKPGTPPPLCYLSGLGEFQFDNHPLAITGFTYSLPIDVDYIRALPQPATSGAGQATSYSGQRLINNGVSTTPPKFSNGSSTGKPTYVPTKMQISITAHPIVSRNNISNKFSLKEYATGQLLLGKSRSSGGIW